MSDKTDDSKIFDHKHVFRKELNEIWVRRCKQGPHKIELTISDSASIIKKTVAIEITGESIPLAVSPEKWKLKPNESVQFQVTGGAPPYTYTVLKGRDLLKKDITAEGKLDVVHDKEGDITVEVKDSSLLPNTAKAEINVSTSSNADLEVEPCKWQMQPGGRLQFYITGWKESYTWKIGCHDKELEVDFDEEKRILSVDLSVQTPIKDDLVGLALSGGGVRSAAFNLGLLQALDEKDCVKNVDYLSTVSGGGYIGAALTRLSHNEHGKFPFPRSDYENTYLRWIRTHASYLTPGDGLNNQALAAAYLRGGFVNLVILLPLIFSVMYILTWGISVGCELHQTSQTSKLMNLIGDYHLSVIMAMLISMIILEWIRSKLGRTLIAGSERSHSRALLWLILIVVGGLLAVELMQDNSWNIKTGLSNHFLSITLPIPILLLISTVIMYLANIKEWKINTNLVFEFLEIETWIVVFFLLYIFMPAKLWGYWYGWYPPVFMAFAFMGIILLTKLLVNYLFYAALSTGSARLKFLGNQFFSIESRDILCIGSLFFLFGMLPVFYEFLVEVSLPWGIVAENSDIVSGISLTGILTAAAGWWKRTPNNEVKGYVAFLLRTGLVLLLTAALLWTYHLLVFQHQFTGGGPLKGQEFWWVVLVFCIMPWLFIVAVVDINYVSLHRYYRNRLLQAFFPPNSKSNKEEKLDDEDRSIVLQNILVSKNHAPYHLVNANLITVGSSRLQNRSYRLRGGDSFIFSPRFIGSQATGYVPTNTEAFQKIDLATACSISGAAIDPNTGETKSWPLRVIMGMLNVRLGFWMLNPKFHSKHKDWSTKYWFQSWVMLILKEIFAMPSEENRNVRLSDGGHFENLGLYELIRRRCRLIVVSDAAADFDWTFQDFTRALQLIRTDFGAEVKINLDALRPQKSSSNSSIPYSSSPFVTGTIRYEGNASSGGSEVVNGRLIYIKTTLFKSLPKDVLGYYQEHKTFPDQPTADQFFDERQFEAYRELGYQAGLKVTDLPIDYRFAGRG